MARVTRRTEKRRGGKKREKVGEKERRGSDGKAEGFMTLNPLSRS
jgi:hypothetical protein